MEVEVVDWDLHAVVRGCCTTNSKQPSSHAPPPPPPPLLDEFSNKHLPPVQPQREELLDLFRPFFFSPVPPVEHPEVSSNVLPPPPRNNFTPRSKRRKNQFKKVCEVPAEGLASDDKWSWRKYGQKPIKGSPYPRGYYRCSSSKGCPARKQVERSRTDPKMFIVTYTSEHNHPAPTHRNSLAGISRHQSNSNNKLSVSSSKQGTSSSSVPTSPSDGDDDDVVDMQQSIKTEDDHQYQLDEILMHQEREESGGGGNGEEVLLLDEDFFDGLDEIANRSACGSDMVC